eukprot:1161365-Pelagomonas_calceolata.AAC.6
MPQSTAPWPQVFNTSSQQSLVHNTNPTLSRSLPEGSQFRSCCGPRHSGPRHSTHRHSKG